MYRPLADRLRPKTLDEMVGQRHLVGENGLLRRLIESGSFPNMVFYGPAGVGKTTVARIMAEATSRKLHKLNGTTATLADVKAVLEEPETLAAPNGVLLYLDEIQYFNKKQQQSLLEVMEDGRIALIASTTENPYFYIYNSLLSRSTVFEFYPVEPNDIKKAIKRALAVVSEELGRAFHAEEHVLDLMAQACGGDVRKAINAVEIISMSAPSGKEPFEITEELALSVSQRSSMRYDRDGDMHFDLLSALQKSIRGSDENAALHYLARLIVAGDLLSICRRVLVTASEDVGLAHPQALPIVKAAVDAALQLGLPEARIPLAQAVVLLATAPKSNSTYLAVDRAIDDVKAGKAGDIPADLKDAHYQGAKKLGRGLRYKYPHDYPNHYTPQQYLPDELVGTVYYQYGDNKLEQATKRYWDEIKGKRESQ